jgi:hypothetical protein
LTVTPAAEARTSGGVDATTDVVVGSVMAGWPSVDGAGAGVAFSSSPLSITVAATTAAARRQTTAAPTPTTRPAGGDTGPVTA